MELETQNIRRGFGYWLTESTIGRLSIICIIILLLLIPKSWIENLIHERQHRKTEVTQEITDKWARSQTFSGPVFVVPYLYKETVSDKEGKPTEQIETTHLYLLADELHITGHAEPEIRRRGIYDAVVYNSQLKVNGTFDQIELQKSGINPDNLQWDKARIAIGLNDLKGLKYNPSLTFNGQPYVFETDFYNSRLFHNTLIAVPQFEGEQTTAGTFNFELDIRGSNLLHIQPLGKNTTVQLTGSWSDPKFDGDYLPDTRTVAENHFSASWSVPSFNRKRPQQWLEDKAKLAQLSSHSEYDGLADQEANSLGVAFLLPVDGYQKTMRSVKYGMLVILLSFISLFFTEIITKTRVHLIQYVLIGSAMIIYYSLLLSLSEHIGFNLAYLLSSLATITLITAFIGAILKNKGAAWVFSMILSVFYLFIFVIMQMQDQSLLFGSIGLFVIVAVLMYFSSRINWENS